MRDTLCKLVLGIDRRLFLAGAQGVMIIDGEADGSCADYVRVFKAVNLSGRQLAAEPFFLPSDASQWIQIADIGAYTAYQAVARQPHPPQPSPQRATKKHPPAHKSPKPPAAHDSPRPP